MRKERFGQRGGTVRIQGREQLSQGIGMEGRETDGYVLCAEGLEDHMNHVHETGGKC